MRNGLRQPVRHPAPNERRAGQGGGRRVCPPPSRSGRIEAPSVAGSAGGAAHPPSHLLAWTSERPLMAFRAGCGKAIFEPSGPDLDSNAGHERRSRTSRFRHTTSRPRSRSWAPSCWTTRHLYGLLVEEHLRPEHFYREQHGAVFEAMVELSPRASRKIDHLTVAEALRELGKLDDVGGPEAIEELAGWVPAAGHAREYGRIVRDDAQKRALLTASYEIQASVLSRESPARELVERAERMMLEVAARRPAEEDPVDRGHPRRGDRQAPPAVDLEDGADRDSLRLQGHRWDDGGLSAGQPDRDRGPPVDG